MRIGVIGLGAMGRPVCERLLDSGHGLCVWNRTPQKAQGLTNARVMATVGQLVRSCDVILSFLANQEAIQSVYHGAEGILSEPLEGKIVVEFSTGAPQNAIELETAVLAQGGRFLECPVGGTVGPAREGTLLGLAGGAAETFEAARPVLELLTRRLEYMGPAGNGAAMKLAINLPLMVYWNALGEAVGLATGQGVDADLALDILADSSGAIGAAKKRIEPIKALLKGGLADGVNFSLANAYKDMGLMVALAQEHQTSHSVIDSVRQNAAAAVTEGWEDRDASLLGVHILGKGGAK